MSEYPKYRAPQPIEIENRVWPTRRIRSMPLCVPVDLRDGNQAREADECRDENPLL